MATRSPAEKLLTGLPKAARDRAQGLSATRRTLIDVATELFSQKGYAGTSLDAIVSGARVTKGALYHHFSSKQAIFEAVFDKLETDAEATLRKAVKRSRDPWQRAGHALRAYLKVLQDPGYQRVVVQDGPAVLGYERFRDHQGRGNYAQLSEIIRSLITAPGMEITDELVDTFSRLALGAISAAADSIAEAADPQVAVGRFESAFTLLLNGIHALASPGEPDPTPADGEVSGS